MKEKKKQIVLSILGILSLILITVGVTYAVFTYTKLGSTENTITTGTLKFLYTENTGVGAGISLTNAFPVSDAVGKAYSTENYVFDFSVESTNTGSDAISYEVTLRQKSDSTLSSDIVKVYLTDMTEGTDTEILAPALYSSLTTTSIDVGKEIEKTLYQGTVPGGSNDYLKNFRLRMWIDEKADFSATGTDAEGNPIYPYNGKTFTAIVNVYANAKVVVEEDTTTGSTEINSIKAGEVELTKVEDQDYQYETTVAAGTTSTTIEIETKDPEATVTVEKLDSLAYGKTNVKQVAVTETLELTEGDNYFKVTVTSPKEAKDYKIKITVPVDSFVLKDKILSETVVAKVPTLTNTSSAAGDISGLYKSTDTNDGSPTYYFRGNVENNYVDFAGFIWRIVRVNEDGTIRMIMSDGINNNELYLFNSSYTSRPHMYYSNSNAKTQVETWYTSKLTNYSNKIATGDYFCEQAKVSFNSNYATNSGADMVIYDSYTPSFKCSIDGNEKGMINSNIGLITYDEIIHAGAYYDLSNENFYLYNGGTTWTMSPGGYYNGLARGWTVSSKALNSNIASKLHLRPVINLNSDVTAKGLGTSERPYAIQ